MKRPVKTGLPAPSVPIEWATIADGIFYTVQIPIKSDGKIETGDIGAQTSLTLDNLKRSLKAAGGTLADVAQVLIYLTDPADFPGMNAVYAKYFTPPYPNRATIIAQLLLPGDRIEIVAYAHIHKRARAATRTPAKTAMRRRPARHRS